MATCLRLTNVLGQENADIAIAAWENAQDEVG